MLSVFIGAVLMLTGCVLSYRNGYNDAVRDAITIREANEEDDEG